MLRLPGTRIHRCGLDEDPDRLAAWLLDLVDESPDRLAIVSMPPHGDEAELDEIEARFIAAYDIAKYARPNLSVKLLHGVDLHHGQPRDRIIVAVHEHRWVGGHCANGCRDTRNAG